MKRRVTSDELLAQLEWRRKQAQLEAAQLSARYPIEAAGARVAALVIGREIRRRKTLQTKARVRAHLQERR
jgi:hypothetical protein